MQRISGIAPGRVLLALLFVAAGSFMAMPSAHAFEAPKITVPSTVNGVVGQLLSLPVSVSGSPAPVVVALDLPLGLNLTAGILGGTPTQAGQKNITILATNLLGTDLKVVSLNITNPLGTSPSFTSLLSGNGTVGQVFSQVLAASGTGPITYAAQNLPAGLSLVGDTISGTPTGSGEFDVTISATNVAGVDTRTLHLSISLANAPAHYTGLSTATGTVGQAFEHVLSATGLVPLTVNATNLPAGLSQVGNKITGIPQVAGTFTISISVSNLVNTELNDLTLTVGELTAPTITSALSVKLASGEALNYTITATGSQPMLFATGNLPSGVVETGPTLSGTAANGTYNITLVVSNAAGQDVKTLVVTIGTSTGGGNDIPATLDTDGDGIPNVDDYDDDNDGFPDGIEEVAGSNPLDYNSTPMGGSASGPWQDLSVKKMSVKLNFTKSKSDMIQVQGSVKVGTNVNLNGQKVAVDVGGVAKLFTLNAKGLAKDGASLFQIKVGKGKKGSTQTMAKFSLRMKAGDFQPKLANYGLKNVAAVKVQKSVPTAIWFNGVLFYKSQTQVYSAKAGFFGKSK